MVSEKKTKLVEEVKADIMKYPVVGIIDMFKMPGRQLHEIRNRLRGKAVIRMVKKRLIKIALESSGADNIKALGECIQGEPALILTDMNPFRLARIISESKSQAAAKEGDISPRDIVVKAGPTSLAPGPVIGEFQRLKIPAMVEADRIAVRHDTVVARSGDRISRELAGMLSKLGIEPIEIGLNLLAAWEGGMVYAKDILFVPPEEYACRLRQAFCCALGLSMDINYFTADNISLLLAKAHREARGLSVQAGIATPDTIGMALANANAQAQALLKAAEKKS